jgi:hypothetical protein
VFGESNGQQWGHGERGLGRVDAAEAEERFDEEIIEECKNGKEFSVFESEKKG